MARFNLLSLAVSFLAISCIVLVQCEEAEPTEEAAAEPAEKAESQPAEEGASQEPESSESASAETTAPEAEDAREDGNPTSIGEEKRLDSNETMEDAREEEERADVVSTSSERMPSMYHCERGEGSIKYCTLHCWWNGWKGGECRNRVCICLWDGFHWADTQITKKPKGGSDNRFEARDEELDDEMEEEGISSNTTTTLPDTEKVEVVSSVSPSEESSVSAAEEASDSPNEEATTPEA